LTRRLAETVTVTSKGQITIPSRLRKKLGIEDGEKLLVFEEGKELRMIPVPKLSELAGVDEALFKNRKPSKELEVMRNEWSREFDKRIKAKKD
jgi:AbrB family looped-hinge helix DNA binding protein